MPYKLTLSLNGQEIPNKVYKEFVFDTLILFFPFIDEMYPAKDGYTITVGRVGSKHRPLDRKTFRRQMAKKNDQKLLMAYFHKDEYSAFISKKYQSIPGKADIPYDGPNPNDYDNVDWIHLYPHGYYIFELVRGDDEPKGDFRKYLLPGDPDGEDYFSKSIAELEKIMFLQYLADLQYQPGGNENRLNDQTLPGITVIS